MKTPLVRGLVCMWFRASGVMVYLREGSSKDSVGYRIYLREFWMNGAEWVGILDKGKGLG